MGLQRLSGGVLAYAARVAPRALQLAALLAPLLITAPLAAAPTAAERETARGLMEEGDRLAAAGELRTAMLRYQSAHAMMHVPTTGLALARAQAKLGMLVEARAVAMEVVNIPALAGEPRVFADARKSASDLTVELEPRVPSLTTTVTPEGVQSSLSVDGVKLPVEARDVPYRANPGAHTLLIEAAGYAPESVQVQLAEGQAHSISVQLKPMATASNAVLAPVPMLASTSAAPVAATSGGGGPVDDPAGPGRTRGIIGLGVGGAALVVGTITGIMSATTVSDVKEHCKKNECDPSQRGKLSTADTLAWVANVTVPLGLIGIGYGVYELLTLPSMDASKAQDKSLQVAFTGTGVVIGGTL